MKSIALAADAVLGVLAFTLFVMMLVVPTVYQPVKGVLLAAVLAGIVWQVIRSGRLRLHPLIACASAVYVAVGLVFVLRGVWLNAPGALAVSKVYVLWPAVYTVLIAAAASSRVLNALSQLLVLATIVICGYSLIYILWAIGWWPDLLYLPLDQGQDFTVRNGTVEFNLYSIASLIFLVPYVAAMLILIPKDEAPVSRPTLWVALGLGLFVSLLSGRRGLQLVVVLGPLVAMVLRFLVCEPRSVNRIRAGGMAGYGVVVIAAAIVARTALGIRVGAAFDWFVAGFRFSSDRIAMMRASQSAELLAGWWRSPWLGWGHGASLATMVRADDMPWAYELSYLALLLHTGAVGVFIYAVGPAFIFLIGFLIARSGYRLGRPLLAVLVGSAMFLVANATNPYLSKFDYEWIIFLPLAFINLWLLERHEQRGSATQAPAPLSVS
jgi:hypothetical protein